MLDPQEHPVTIRWRPAIDLGLGITVYAVLIAAPIVVLGLRAVSIEHPWIAGVLIGGPACLLGLVIGWGNVCLQRDRQRWERGLCVRCGYDLRQSEVRCPECGSPLPQKEPIKP